MDISLEIKKHTAEVESIIREYLPAEEGFQKTVISAMNYSFLAGGKRLRPMLMLETYRLFGGEGLVVAPFMAALEMIHTYSLIHDDLPAMDDDDYRRGRLTCHKVYGEAMAILAGDGLLNCAFETALKAAGPDPDNPHIIPALRILANCSGLYGMLGGQVVDVESEGMPLNQEKLDFIYALKTGALIRAAMTIGATLAGADEADIDIVGRVADDVGLAFQIRDDILDVESDLATLGKPTGSDEKNDKTTYVTLKGIDAAKAEVERISRRAVLALTGLPVKNEFLTELIRSLITRDR
ncbi:MAG: polyprenyl synthetase family protein [Clostridiales bacterium]|nr:polyprenyl synthetase family protein [Clostridiales bacterium]